MKRVLGLLLAAILILPAVSSGDAVRAAEDAPVLRTVYQDDFETTDVGSRPSAFGGWSTNSQARAVANFNDNKAIYMKATYETGKRPDNVLQLKRSFKGNYEIAFDLYVLSADKIYIAAKTETNGNAWMSGMNIYKGSATSGTVSIENSVKNTAVTIPEFTYDEWHKIRITMDATTGKYSYYVDDLAYINGATLPSNFDFDNVMFRIQEYGQDVGATSELYVDNFSVKRYDTAPVITLKGNAEYKVMEGQTFVDPGASATDVIDGDLTSKIQTEGSVDTDQPGSYTLTYSVTAADGTTTTATRNVTVVESRIKGMRIKHVEDFESVQIEGRPTGTNACYADGGTNKVVSRGGGRALYMKAPKNDSKNTNACVEYKFSGLEHPVFSMDFSMESFGKQFQVVFKDLDANQMTTVVAIGENGVVSCFGTATQKTVSLGSDYNLTIEINHTAKTADIYLNGERIAQNKSVTWSDDNENMLWRMQVWNFNKTSDIALYLDNLYIMTAQKPVITLKGESEMTALRGEKFDDPGASATDIIDGDLSSKIVRTGEVDITTEGTYTLRYDVKATDGTAATSVYRTVTVKKKEILAGATIAGDSAEGDYPVSNVTDGDDSTAWKSTSDNAWLILDFEKPTLLETITVSHEDIQNAYAYYTVDGTSWKTMAFNTKTETGKLTLTADVFAAKSVKLCLEGATPTVYEMKADCADESVAAYLLQCAEKSLPSTGTKIGADIVLASEFGYGGTVTWSSSNAAVLSDSGKVTLPDEETEVTLTATAEYAHKTKQQSFGPFTVRDKSYGQRVKVSEDMESTSIGSVPNGANDSWAQNGASLGVAEFGSGKALKMVADYSGTSNPDAVIEYDISGVPNPVISFDFTMEKTGKTFQALMKDVTNSKNVQVVAAENETLKLLSQSIGTVQSGTTYHVVLEFDDDNNTVSVRLNGEQKVSDAPFVAEGTAWDWHSCVWRFQTYGHVQGGEICAYVDNLKIETHALPVVTLLGAAEMTLQTGMAFDDPGATAYDIIDGNISDRITVSDLPDTDKVGTYYVKYIATTEDGTESEACVRTVHVVDPNLMTGAVLSSETANVNYLTDGYTETVWTSASDTAFMAQFAKTVIADRLELTQSGVGISQIALSTSDDGVTWKPLAADITYNGSIVTAVFDPLAVTRIRCDIKGTDIGVVQAALYAQSAHVVAADKAALTIVSTSDGEDIVLPKTGTYGSSVTWKSSTPSIIADNGSVLRPKTTTTVTMTATLDYIDASAEKTFSVTVSGSVGGNAGGGAVSRGDSNNVVATVAGETVAPTDTPIVPNVAENKLYGDVENSHWAYRYIETLTNAGVVSGTAANQFEPDRWVTRAEYLKMLLSTIVLPEAGTDNPFVDIADDAWYATYVLRAYANDIVNGMGEGTFAPEGGITRQDMAVMSVRALNKAGIAVSQTGDVTFADGNAIAAYAQESIAALGEIGILGGDENGNFRPNDSLTRAEATKVIAMILNLMR